MDDTEFNSRYEDTLAVVEDTIENSGADLDYETVNEILTITCPDGSSIIISRQSATHQLWLAAKSGGFHFDLKDGLWVCDKDQEKLSEKLASICMEQGDATVDFTGKV